MGLENLYIIGTSHIASGSIKEVNEVIQKVKPTIVAIELDHQRLRALFSKQKIRFKWGDVRRLGVKGYLFNILGAFIEHQLGKRVGVVPGAEMKEAVYSARKIQAKVALIDQDITITLRKLSKRITWKEKGRVVKDLIAGLCAKKKIKIDLSKVPPKKMIKQLTTIVKKRYPSIYKTLIVERNMVMAQNLYNLISQHPGEKIVAVVGAGHEEEIKNVVKKRMKTSVKK